MDPSLLNYLQSQQQEQIPLEEQTGDQETLQTQEQEYNPFSSGIRNAIDSARESLGMTNKQQEKALRRSILSFASNIAQEPKHKGFFANWGSAARAGIPAMTEYDKAEGEYETQNNALANQILAGKERQNTNLAKAEEQGWRRQMEEDKLSEMRRLHDMNADYKQVKLDQSKPLSSSLGEGFIPIESKSERLLYSKDKKATGEILKELSSIKDSYEEFRDLTKDNLIDPMTPYGIGSASSKGKDLFSYFTGNKAGRKQTVKRKALEAKLGKFAVEIERKLKGGVLTEGMVKRFEDKGLLPNISDAPDVFEQKLSNLLQEIGEHYKASDASLRYNSHISPYDLPQLEALNNSTAESSGQNEIQQEPTAEEQFMLMQDSSGSQYQIPTNQVNEALADGLMAVE